MIGCAIQNGLLHTQGHRISQAATAGTGERQGTHLLPLALPALMRQVVNATDSLLFVILATHRVADSRSRLTVLVQSCHAVKPALSSRLSSFAMPLVAR